MENNWRIRNYLINQYPKQEGIKKGIIRVLNLMQTVSGLHSPNNSVKKDTYHRHRDT